MFTAEYLVNLSVPDARDKFGKLRCRVEPCHSPYVEAAVLVFNPDDARALEAECAASGVEFVKVIERGK